MNYYQGDLKNDPLKNGGTYVDENNTGLEIFNFKPIGNTYYGNVNPTHDGQINLNRIYKNIDNESDCLNGVLVIWCATAPEVGTVVVGWYKNAEVFRKWEPFPENNKNFDEHRDNHITTYRIGAQAGDVFLVNPQFRNFIIPQANGNNCGFGMSHVRYTNESQCADLKSELIEYIKGFSNGDPRLLDLNDLGREGNDESASMGWGATNPEVEKIAVEFTKRFYQKKGYTVKSVENLNRGWDLEATKGERTLNIEVKGLSGDQCSVGLTPNEYRVFQSADDNYRLFVVTSCLNNIHNYFICNNVDGSMTFLDEKRRYKCVANEVISAIVTLGGEID
jgi:hypothetical protein